jgi:hypothetical protein
METSMPICVLSFTESELPNRVSERRESVLPRPNASKMLHFEAKRATVRKLNAEPTVIESNTEIVFAKRAVQRIDTLLPRFVQSRMENWPRMKPLPSQERREPIRTNARADTELPRLQQSKTEIFEPKRAALRSENELPSVTAPTMLMRNTEPARA